MKKPNLKNMNIKKPKLQLPEKVKPKAGKEAADKKKEKIKENNKKSKNSVIAVPSRRKPKKEVDGSLQETGKSSAETVTKTASSPAKSSSAKRKTTSAGAGKQVRSGSQKAKRLDQEKQKQRKARQEARKKEAFRKKVILGIGIAVCLLLIICLVACPGKEKTDKTETSATSAESTAGETGPGPVSTAEVRHFSFPMLIADEMAGDDSVLTVSQFRQILQELYDSNYILVDFYSIAGVQENEDGSVIYTSAELDIPEGKIPFVLSQRDLSYSLHRIGKGYASRLIVDEANQLTDEYQRADGAILRGSYDVVTILEEFIQEHPDFSYNNARGVLGLTGYNGILGYRTSELLGRSAEEGNPYAVYGTFDVNAEIEACRPVIEALKQLGWHFASYGNNYCSYGAEYAMVVNDMDTWMADVSGLIGGADILIYPCETDVAGWSEYNPANPKFSYLRDKGFRYYCIEEKDNPSWLQIRDTYVRQGIKEIDCYDDFVAFMTA